MMIITYKLQREVVTRSILYTFPYRPAIIPWPGSGVINIHLWRQQGLRIRFYNVLYAKLHEHKIIMYSIYKNDKQTKDSEKDWNVYGSTVELRVHVSRL
jgi:hypothetical protein